MVAGFQREFPGQEAKRTMSTAAEYPYDTRLNILFEHLQVIDEKSLAEAAPHKWYNQTLCRVNDSVVRLGVIEGE